MNDEFSGFFILKDINFYFKLFRILIYMFYDCFKFSGPFIAQIGADPKIGQVKTL